MQRCAVNCMEILDSASASFYHGAYRPGRITLFRSALEPAIVTELVRSSAMEGGRIRQVDRLSAIENAVLNLGHESSHSHGVDRSLPGQAYHPNAERAGREALQRYRSGKQ